MKTLDCTLRLAADSGNPNPNRVVEFTLSGTKTNGTWDMVADSPDPRLNIGVASGIWTLGETAEGSNDWTLYLLKRDDLMVLVEMYGLSSNFLDRIFCGSGWGGNAWHQGPPEADLTYDLEFLCA